MNTLSPAQIEQINKILAKGNRIELIPCKDRIKVIEEIRKEIK